MLELIYKSEHPFSVIRKIALDPATYKGQETMQLFVNDIDIGFVPQSHLKYMQNFWPHKVVCTEKTDARGRKWYCCFLFGSLE